MKLTNELRKEYESLYSTCQVRPERLVQVDRLIDRILNHKTQYEAVQNETRVPWFVIAAIHNLESSGSFRGHLHNGDPLSQRTTHIPKGRPVAGSPPFTWEESAKDALEYDDLTQWTDWSIAGISYKLEGFNGFGYRGKINSPYLWSFSNHYQKGKYVSDGSYDANAVSEQCGGMVLLKQMEARSIIKLSSHEIPQSTDYSMTTTEMQAAFQDGDIEVWEIMNAPKFKTLIELNCRSGVGTEFPVVTTIPAHAIIQSAVSNQLTDPTTGEKRIHNVGTTSNGLWLKAKYSGKQGFVRASMKYLIPWHQNNT